METGKTCRMPEAGCNGCYRQRRGVCRQRSVRRNDGFNFLEQLPLDVQILEHGLDDQIAM